MNKRKGISLIVLVITILVMIILAGVVIVSLSKNNPVNKAKEATFKTDVSTFEGDLSFYLANSLAENSTLKMEDVDAAGYSEIKKVINSFAEKYADKFEVVDGELIYIGADDKEEVWAAEVGLGFKVNVNSPVLADGMIPIKYNGNNWVICSEIDNSWYNYGTKKYANIMLSDGKFKDKNAIGTIVADSDLGSMFVWIPRYAYSIKNYKKNSVGCEGSTQLIHDITFLEGNTNVDKKGHTYPKSYDAKKVPKGKSTPKIVHPAFYFNGKELNGIWLAKFEASMNEVGTGHINENKDASCNFTDANHSMIKIVPDKMTWRYLKIVHMSNNSKNMINNANIYGLKTGVNTHLIKNVEWGAAAYLATSKYGFTPTINNKIENETSSKYEGFKGYAGGGAYKSNTTQSTTGNITGIYDMNGGAWEYVAAFDNNKNNMLSVNGGEYIFPNNEIAPEYVNLFDRYEVSTKESDPSIHEAILNAPYNDAIYGNSFKKAITKEKIDLMATHHGDAMYEYILEDEWSYKGKTISNKWEWIKTLSPVNFEYSSTVVNEDFAHIGNTDWPFYLRGGDWWADKYSGLFSVDSHRGTASLNFGFRPALVNI